MSQYNLIAATTESTVVAEYTPETRRSESYQSEAALEREFIRMLTAQGYEYLTIHDEAALIANLRRQLELLNNYTFTDSEWDRFFKTCIASANDGILEKTRKIQTDHVQVLRQDSGASKNIYLLDKKNIHNNRLQVLNQYEESAGSHDTRYDVTILVNGLPLVHVELKRRGVAIREAFNQIKRYQRDSFWASSGLYEYVQIFVISNGTHTKYYSNTTRDSHIREMGENRNKSKKTINSFEFTSFWADGNNKVIADLVDFTKTFLVKHTILNILTRYCVFTAENLLLVMRPYQIAATERILNRIEVSSNYKQGGTVEAGGYIWHTTGSGKTLTSFKTAQLASRLPYIDKVLFVVDRKDLDYQDLIDELTEKFPVGQSIAGEKNEEDFIKLYGNILRLKNILSTFDRFAGNELLPERIFQDYQSIYIDLYQKYRPKADGDKENINDDIEFEVELIRQVEINIDYILLLVEQYHASNCMDKSILGAIDRAVNSSIQLRSKKDLIEGFIETVNASTEVERDWHAFVEQ